MQQNNPLHFPEQTLLRRSVPKTAFYRHLEVNGKMKQHFVDDVESITWLYKLSASVLNVEEGKDVTEIVVFQVVLKEKECPNDVFLFIDSNMPRHIVFLLQYQEDFKLLFNYKEWKDKSVGTFSVLKSFSTEWMSIEHLCLPLQGQSMDSIYENMAGTLSGYGTASREASKRAIELETVLNKKIKAVEALQKRIRAEKQLNRQIEMSAEARSLKKEIASLQTELKDIKI